MPVWYRRGLNFGAKGRGRATTDVLSARRCIANATDQQLKCAIHTQG
jgi:hypothetical protein